MASTTGSATGGSSGDCEGEEQEDSSSSLDMKATSDNLKSLNLQDNSQTEDGEDELTAFRQQWQRELEGTPTPTEEPKPQPAVVEPQTDEEKAKEFFLRGVEMERGGKLYEAIQNYKRAMQILPDVETRLYESSELRGDTPEVESETEEVLTVEHANTSDDEDAVEGEDLLTRLQRILARKGTFCEPEFPTKGGHVSWLPYEVVVLVLRWVVGAELDAASLERAAAACRGLYVAARDPDIWRTLCVKTWGIECGTPRSGGYLSWRHMYVSRPRLLLHGCYISKTTYLRHGENSFQDQFYRPWYLIEYYRYLRFFPEGVVLMWTTAEEPVACVGHLRYRTPKTSMGIMAGHYRLMGDKVVIVIKKTNADKKPAQASNTRFRSRRKDSHDQHEQTFHIELQLSDARARRNWRLAWRRYSACARRDLRDLRDHCTQFELSAAKFPPFAFSPVRAYTAHAHAPLLNTHAYT
ncbi:F-box only protein 9 [Galleria mellonella]|uniref:F-box only protein 9 n=1 Tax=Galleria mellonella TaxID=7137 RepID=A0ABM3N3L3_GALME|nr:F-box only protein 9 [Galleria mellonella]